MSPRFGIVNWYRLTWHLHPSDPVAMTPVEIDVLMSSLTMSPETRERPLLGHTLFGHTIVEVPEEAFDV